ncbi:hypothetical protein RI367_001871 [Sorochytrium milnesiophthora]
MERLSSWSKTPAAKAYFGEFIGSFFMILLGEGVNAQLLLFNDGKSLSSDAAGWLGANMAWALAVAFGVFVSWNVSGGHLNPSISLAMALSGSLPWVRVPGYVVSQFLGCFVGAAFTYFNHGRILSFVAAEVSQPWSDTAAIFYTGGRSFTTFGSAFFTELWCTTVLVVLVMAIADKRNGINPVYQPFFFALPIFAIGMSLGTATGWAMNAARDIAPRIFAWMVFGSVVWTHPRVYFWIPLVAPLLGATIGTYCYRFLMPNVDEQPVVKDEKPIITTSTDTIV